MAAHPVHQLPPIGPIDPEQPQLFTGAAKWWEEEPGPRRVRDGGRRALRYGRDGYRNQILSPPWRRKFRRSVRHSSPQHSVAR